LISEDNHFINVFVCSYPISSPHLEYLWLKEWHCHSVALTVAEAVAAVMDMRELTKQAKQAKDLEKAKEDFQASQW